MKTTLFTHTDLDGVSCAIVAKLFFPDVKVFYCNYNEVNDIIWNELSTYKTEHRIIISDLSYSMEQTDITLELLKKHQVLIADHHVTSTWMGDIFNWRGNHAVSVADGDKCGAVLLYELLKKYPQPEPHSYYMSHRVNKYLKLVNLWDLWKWTDEEHYDKSNLFNNEALVLSNTYGMLKGEDFVRYVYDYLHGDSGEMFPKSVEEKVWCYNANQMTIIDEAVKGLKTGYVDSPYYGRIKYFYVEDGYYYQSLIAQVIRGKVDKDTCEEEFIVVNEPDGGSLRSLKPGVDLSIIAKEFGGGGHRDAAKFSIEKYGDYFIVDGQPIKAVEDKRNKK